MPLKIQFLHNLSISKNVYKNINVSKYFKFFSENFYIYKRNRQKLLDEISYFGF